MISALIADWDWGIFLVGCVGALAPEILRWYRFYSAGRREGFPVHGWYVIFSLMFIGLGGFVAVLLDLSRYWSAFSAGAALPVIISALYPDDSTSKGTSSFRLKHSNQETVEEADE